MLTTNKLKLSVSVEVIGATTVFKLFSSVVFTVLFAMPRVAYKLPTCFNTVLGARARSTAHRSNESIVSS